MTTVTRNFWRIGFAWIVALVASTTISSTGFAQDNNERDVDGVSLSITRSGPVEPEDLMVNLAELTNFTLEYLQQRTINRTMVQQWATLHENGRSVGKITVLRTLGAGSTIPSYRFTKNDKTLRKTFETAHEWMVAEARDIQKGEKLKGQARGRFFEFSHRSSRCIYLVANYRFGTGEHFRNGDTQISLLYCQPPQRFDRQIVLDFVQNARLVDADDNRAAYAARETKKVRQVAIAPEVGPKTIYCRSSRNFYYRTDTKCRTSIASSTRDTQVSMEDYEAGIRNAKSK